MQNSRGLHRLIVGCLDDERTLHRESGRVDFQRKEVLSRLADERGRFVEELQRLGEPCAAASESWLALLREFGRAVRVLAGGRNSGDSIASCRRSCGRTEALYEQAMRLEWSHSIRPVLLTHRDRIRHSGGELLALQF
jgi:hypothetical protein